MFLAKPQIISQIYSVSKTPQDTHWNMQLQNEHMNCTVIFIATIVIQAFLIVITFWQLCYTLFLVFQTQPRQEPTCESFQHIYNAKQWLYQFACNNI